MHPKLEKGPMSPEDRKAAFERFAKNSELNPITVSKPAKSSPPELGKDQKVMLMFMGIVVIVILTYDWLSR